MTTATTAAWLPAGWDLDLRIAAQLGWAVAYDEVAQGGFDVTAHAWAPGYDGKPLNLAWYHGFPTTCAWGPADAPSLPSWSSSIAPAVELLNKLRELGWKVGITSDVALHGELVWRATLGRLQSGELAIGYAEDLPLAIARAAVQALTDYPEVTHGED